jgi:hypothetical protein
MAAPSVTPVALDASAIAVGGTPVIAAVGPVLNGGVIQNPASNTDQGLTNAEDIVVNPVGAAVSPSAAGGVNGTNFRLPPGYTWTLIPGQTTSTSVNAITTGHKFSGFKY